MERNSQPDPQASDSKSSQSNELSSLESATSGSTWLPIPKAQSLSVGCILILLSCLIVITVSPVAGINVDRSSPDDSGSYTLDSVVTSGVTDSPSQPSITGEFTKSSYTGVAGDPIEIVHGYDNPDGPAYLLVGGNQISNTGQTVGFVDVIKITGTSTTINTRLIGTEKTNVKSCGLDEVSCDLEFRDANGDLVADSLSNLTGSSGATGAGGLVRPLVPQRYRLAITDGTFTIDNSGVVTPTAAADQADLILRKPKLSDNVEVFTSVDPRIATEDIDTESLNSLRKNGFERTAVTEGNHVVLGFESTGIWGALSYFAADADSIEAGKAVDAQALVDLLAAEEGVSLQVQQTNPSGNEPRSELDLSQADPDDLTVILADEGELDTPSAPNQFYLVLDTGDDGPFTHNPEPGDKFSVRFALEGSEGVRYRFNNTDQTSLPDPFSPVGSGSEHPELFPYWGVSDTGTHAEASFSIRERFVRYDRVTDEGEILVEAENGRITGTTSLLPAVETSVTLVNDAGSTPNRKESQLDISDGEFSIKFGTDELTPGTRLNYNLYQGSTHRDSRTVVIVSDSDNPDRLTISDASQNVTITEGENLSAINVVAQNVGGFTGEGELRLTVENSTVTGSWGVRLDPSESRSFDFGTTTADLEPGTYPFNLRLDGDVHNGTLVVESDPATTTIDEDEPESPPGGGTAGGGSEGNGTADNSKSNDGTADDNGDSSDDESTTNRIDGDGAPSEEPADDGSRSSGLIPLPFGTREALGGTIMVGAVYLLGHWV
ncbi:hypothetical protein GLW36_03255 [Halorubrum terrestre]|uniref:Uncharacterized protein n=1 Tax=Halorubrum distributum TaxID=29283 RepID=A0A6B1I957_9EURY|nr:BGTF surface domain-containing protein [Halorubrum terrestre]MYL15667.1 hypothetical protein [Halorubrum terrestre]